MAKQKGLVHLNGTIGDINFYRLNGKEVARMAGGGFNGDAIKKSPKMVRVRENMNEFGMVSALNKQLRLALHPFYAQHKDGTLLPRLQKLFYAVKDLDTEAVRGQRTVAAGLGTPMGRQLFADFDFGTHRAGNAIRANGVFDAASCSFAVNGLTPDLLAFPETATHVEIFPGVVVFDFETDTTLLYRGTALFFEKGGVLPDLTLAADALPDAGTKALFGCVRFWQAVNGELNVLKEGMGLAVLGVV